MGVFSDDQDTFEQQQELFRPSQLSYCLNLVDLLTEELDQTRCTLGRAQHANQVLVSERDVLVAEIQRHRLRYVQTVQEQNRRHVPHGEHGVPDDTDDPLARARRHILRLEAMNSVLHADLVALRGRLQILCTEHRHQLAGGHQHG